MIDLQNPQARTRLQKAIKTSDEAMVNFRKTRHELIRDYVGSWYSTGGARTKTLVNLMYQTAKIYTVALAANNPKAIVSSAVPENLAFARRFDLNLNKLIADMELDGTFRACVLDSFFSLGCACVMMRDSDNEFHGLLESEEDVWFDPGEIWLNRISMDALILDLAVSDLSKMRFCGHRYRADFDLVRNEPSFNEKVRSRIVPTSKHSIDNADFAQEIASGGAVDDDELKPMIWLERVWLPQNRSIATFAQGFDLAPLSEEPWTGSQGGPYKFLTLGLVPDSVIGVSPAQQLKGLHDLQNRLHRRMERQSDNQRTVNLYAPGAEDEAEGRRKAKDGDWIKSRDPQSVTQVKYGGVDAGNQGFSLFIQEEYDRLAGNLRAMGGLGVQSATVGQEEMIQGGVSRVEADMQAAVVRFAQECIYELAYMMWQDDLMGIQSSMEAEPAGVRVDSSWEPGKRVGKFEDYQLTIEPYSMVYKTPRQKLDELFATLQQLAPLWPMFQASGASLDAEAIVDEIARLTDRPEYKRFITFAAPAETLGGDENTIRQSPVTTRNTVRKNVPTGGTPEARSNILQQVLSGASKPQVNGQQMAAVVGGA